jgi:hypothetical protein
MAEITNSVTPYHYCLNNPVKYIDPTGMYTIYDFNGKPHEIGDDDVVDGRLDADHNDDPDNKPITGIPTSYNDILKGIGDFFGLGLDPKDHKNIDKIELGEKRLENATNAINEVNKAIIVNGVLIIVTEGAGYAVEEFGGQIILRILSNTEFKTAAIAVEKEISVIGPRAIYRQVAEKMGANYLNVTDEGWTLCKNYKFLQCVVERGDDVIFAGKFDARAFDPNSMLGFEIKYLQNNGYSWSKDFTRLIKK